MRLAKALPSINLLFSLVLAGLLILLVIQGRNAARNRDQGLRTFICYFESAALYPKHGPRPTPAQRRVIINFFDGITAKLHEPPCERNQ